MIKKKKRWLRIIGFSLLGILAVPIVLAGILLWMYHDEIIHYVKQEVRQQYGLNTDIRKSEINMFSDWPNASLVLHDIDLRDTLDIFKDKPFLNAEEITLSLNVIPLIHKEYNVNTIVIKKATVQVWIDTSGQSNISFLQQEGSKDSSHFEKKGLRFKNIKLNDLHFIYMDAGRKKAIDLALNRLHVDVKRENETLQLDLNGECLANRLSFHTGRGDYIKGRLVKMKNWKGIMTHDFTSVHFKEVNTLIYDHHFKLDLALQTHGEGLFAIKVHTKKMERPFALSLLTDHLQQKIAPFQWTGSVEVEADIKTPLKHGHDPTILLTAKMENNHFKLNDRNLLLAGIKGLVTLHIPGDSNASGYLTKGTLKADIEKATFKKWPLTGHILISNLEYPVLTADAALDIPATSLNSGQTKGPWSGTANALLDLQIPLQDVTANHWMEYATRCNVVLKSSDIRYKIKNKKSIQLTVLAQLNTRTLDIKRCDVNQDGQSIQATGVVYDFMQKVLYEQEHWKARLKIESENISLENWIDNIKQITEAQPAKRSSASTKTDKPEMDDIVLDVDVKKLSFENMIARQVKGQLLIKPHSAEIKNLQLNTCKGTMQTNLVWKNSKYIVGNAQFRHTEVKEIFQTFRNFKQEIVKAEQLEGIINLDADFSLEVDPTFHVSQNSLSAIVDLNISNGRLRNFEPFEKISKYAFKNRHLDDVEFAELKQRLHFKGTKMNIELAEINSTAFCLHVEGMYDFNGETDLRIQIPWSNLKKIPEDAILGQPGNDGREARSLFLKAVGPNGKVALSYDKTQGGKKEERKKERKKKKKKAD